MGEDRKKVAVITGSDALGSALKLILSDHEVEVRDQLDFDPSPLDLLVWHFDGSVAVGALTRVTDRAPTLVLADETGLLDAVDGGARGFLPASAPLEEIREAISTLLIGGAVVPPQLLGRLLRHLVERRRTLQTDQLLLEDLTKREAEVFRLAAQGADREEIADELFISPATARTHLQRVYKKLGVHSQSELMALAMRNEEGDPQ